MDQEVWAVPYEHTMRYTAEELQEVCLVLLLIVCTGATLMMQ